MVKKNRSTFPYFGFTQASRMDKTGVEEQTSRITKRCIKGKKKMQGLKAVFSITDLTILKAADVTPCLISGLTPGFREIKNTRYPMERIAPINSGS